MTKQTLRVLLFAFAATCSAACSPAESSTTGTGSELGSQSTLLARSGLFNKARGASVSRQLSLALTPTSDIDPNAWVELWYHELVWDRIQLHDFRGALYVVDDIPELATFYLVIPGKAAIDLFMWGREDTIFDDQVTYRFADAGGNLGGALELNVPVVTMQAPDLVAEELDPSDVPYAPPYVNGVVGSAPPLVGQAYQVVELRGNVAHPPASERLHVRLSLGWAARPYDEVEGVYQPIVKTCVMLDLSCMAPAICPATPDDCS
jgi:hypothetical protein